MTMKIPINQLKTCLINSEIYRDSDVGDLVNSIGEVGLLQPIVVTPDNTLLINKNIQRHTVSPLLGAEGWAAEFTIVDAGVARSLLSRREGKGWPAGQRAHPLPPSRWGSSHGALPPCGRSRQRRQ